MQRPVAINVFTDGVMMDIHPSAQKKSTTRKAKNFRVITRDNNSFILTNLKGTELKGVLPSSYVPLAVAERNGVAYILSGEVVDGVATGRGEVGTFPSPTYMETIVNQPTFPVGLLPWTNLEMDGFQWTHSVGNAMAQVPPGSNSARLKKIIPLQEVGKQYRVSMAVQQFAGQSTYFVTTFLGGSFVQIAMAKTSSGSNNLVADFVSNADFDEIRIHVFCITSSSTPVTHLIRDFKLQKPGSEFMRYEYSALYNYGGDSDEFPLLNGRFNSTHFNFNLNKILDIELQNDYDGSVNIIFTGDGNPMRIINSGFAVLPDNKYQIIERNGQRETNRYTKDNFANIIKLIARSNKIMKVGLDGVYPGGKVGLGNWQYFFAYATEDGLETEIIAETFNVPVTLGNKVSNVSGGRQTGELSDKLVKIQLSNLDSSFSHVVVYAVHSDGMLSNTKTGYRINQQYRILDSSIVFTHTGFEQLENYPVDDIINESVNFETAETITQIQEYLVAGNITEKSYDYEPLKKFARAIKLGHKEVTLDMIGPEKALTTNSDGSYFTRLFTEPFNQSVLHKTTGGYNGGYANPKNVHDRLGYWGGEAYPFFAEFIFPGNVTSPLFPVVGIDNNENNRIGTVDSATSTTIDGLESNNGFRDSDMLNSRGIYRFPKRTASGVGKLFTTEGTEDGECRIKVNGVTFKIPALNMDLGGGKTIKDITIGIRFYRGERKRDAIIQGVMIDAAMIPIVRHDEVKTNQGTYNYNQSNGGYKEDNHKLIPAYNWFVESINLWDSYSDSGTLKRTGEENDSSQTRRGLFPMKLNVLNRDPWSVYTTSPNKNPFALLSSDHMIAPDQFSELSGKPISMQILKRMKHRTDILTNRGQHTVGLSVQDWGAWFSCLTPVDLATFGTNRTGEASWTPENQEVKNLSNFCSKAYFQGRPNGDNPDQSKFVLFRLKFNNYIGVRLSGSLLRGGSTGGGSFTGSFNDTKDYLGKFLECSFLGNMYEGSGQRTIEQTKLVYENIDGIRCFPISGRMYWDNLVPDADPTNTLEAQLDGNRKITLFNGDCFINFAVRKLFNTARLDPGSELNENTQPRVGYSIAIVHESNHNGSFRSLETVDLNEGERKHPLNYVTTNTVNKGDRLGIGNPWRDYFATESAGYNKGFSQISDNIIRSPFNLNVPFVQSSWLTRVWHSSKHVPNSFYNGYRNFIGRNYKDYSFKYGQIVKLINNNDKLYCIQDSGVSIIPVNERIQTGAGATGPVYLEASDVLSPFRKMLSEEIGSRHKRSIISTDNNVHGYSDRGIIWKTLPDDIGLERTSDNSIRSYLDNNYPSEILNEIKTFKHDVVGMWNKKFDEVTFTFYKKESGNYDNDKTFTVGVNEVTGKIHSFYGYIGMLYFRVGDSMFSFNLKNPQGIWLHDSENPAVPMNNFYGVQDKSEISYVVNDLVGVNKVFQNQEIISNRVMPELITYKVQGAQGQLILSQSGAIHLYNTKYRGQTWRFAIPKINTVHNQDIERQLDDDVAGAESLLGVKSRVKGRHMVVNMVYNTTKMIELESVNTFYSPMR